MAVLSDSPQIAALRLAVEKKFGHAVESRADFESLVSAIENEINEHIAENTLRRLWGKIKTYDTVFTRTLDVLSAYCGFRHWDEFCRELEKEGGKESKIIRDGNAIAAADLTEGDRIRICWMPDRKCTLRFTGGRSFVATECENATIQPGDSFECSIFIKGQPLFVDNFTHGASISERYAIGLENGLTTLEKL